jgi:hypothetical protein
MLFCWTYAGPSIGKFWQLFTSLNITSRAELDQLFQQHFRHPKGTCAKRHIKQKSKNVFLCEKTTKNENEKICVHGEKL